MIDPATEDSVLRRAIQDGLLTPVEVQEVPATGGECPADRRKNGNQRYEIGPRLREAQAPACLNHENVCKGRLAG